MYKTGKKSTIIAGLFAIVYMLILGQPHEPGYDFYTLYFTQNGFLAEGELARVPETRLLILGLLE